MQLGGTQGLWDLTAHGNPVRFQSGLGCLFTRQTRAGLPAFPLRLASTSKWFISVLQKRVFGHRV